MLKNVLYHWDSCAVDSFIPLSSLICALGKEKQQYNDFYFYYSNICSGAWRREIVIIRYVNDIFKEISLTNSATLTLQQHLAPRSSLAVDKQGQLTSAR